MCYPFETLFTSILMSRFGSHNRLPKIETGSMTKANEQCLVYNVFIVVGVLLSWTLRDKKCSYNNTHTVWVGSEIDINQRYCLRNMHATRSLFFVFCWSLPKINRLFLDIWYFQYKWWHWPHQLSHKSKRRSWCHKEELDYTDKDPFRNLNTIRLIKQQPFWIGSGFYKN